MRPRARLQRALILAAGVAAALVLWTRSPWGQAGRRPTDRGPLPPAAEVEVRLTGFFDGAFDERGTLLPVVGPGGRIDVCLQTSPEIDTSQWQARFSANRQAASGGSYRDPRNRLGTTLCFRHQLPAELPPVAEIELCGDVLDGFDGRGFRLPCHRLRYRADDSERRSLREAMRAAQRALPKTGLESFLRELDGIAARAREAKLPFEALRTDLISVNFLRLEGTPAALAEASERLERLPSWLGQPAAVSWAATVAYEKALVELEGRWNLKAAWEHLNAATRLCHQVLHPMLVTVRQKQAEILGRVGAVGEAVRLLSSAIADCDLAPCHTVFLPSAHGNLAWLIALDPQATDEDLERAAASLEIALEGFRESGNAFEQANQMINRAYLRWRRGLDPHLSLAGARRLLVEVSGTRGSWLEGWAKLVEGFSTLDAGEPERARSLCAGARQSEHPRLAAWASACLGRVHRRRGALDAARRAFDEALLYYEYATPRRLGQTLSLLPGGRADAFYQAARLAAESGEAARAWEILARLDSLTVNEALMEKCRSSLPVSSSEESELLRDLAALEGPAAGRRKRQRASVQRALHERLRELWRRQPGCNEVLRRWPDGPLRFRAFAVEDEILLLHRDPGGEVVLDHRTRLPRRRRQELLQELAAALADRRMPDHRWRELAEPFARALVPGAPGELEPVTVFALHGELQVVPAAALPLPATGGAAAPGTGTGEGAPRWLSEATTVALRPSGTGGTTDVLSLRSAPASPLFVVDPRNDLPSGGRLLRLYRRLFPGARVLAGPDASVANLRGDLPAASWLHVDAHATYDPAFPELSTMLLADQAMTLSELARLPAALSFANLSGCGTGRWRVTADSGRYGIGGLLARLGTPWVVASRGDLPDRLASDFNDAFYRALASGLEVPAAHAQALGAVRRNYPAAAWAALLLLSGGGQNPVLATPVLTREVPRDLPANTPAPEKPDAGNR